MQAEKIHEAVEEASMNSAGQGKIDRRVLLRAAIVGVATAGSRASLSEQAHAKPMNMNAKRKARYQANSIEVRNFYRVNRYPSR